MSILVADDEELFLQATADLLREEGYRCDTVTNSADGFSALRGVPYNLLLADINMPGNADLEFVRCGKQQIPGLPVILMTGFPDLDTAVRGIELDVQDYLVKPIEPASLLRKVEEATGPRSLSPHDPAPTDPKAVNFPHFRRVVDSRGRILEISEEFAGVLGYRPQEIIHQQCMDLAEIPIFPLRTPVDCPTTSVCQMRFLKKSGGTLEALVIRVPARGYARKYQVVEEYVIEITEERRHHSREVFEKKMESIAHFAGGVAHDLNNMLNVVEGYLLLSQESLDPNHRVQEYCQESRSAIRKASRLTQTLLDVSKGTCPCDQIPIDFKSLFNEVEAFSRVRTREGCEIVFSYPESIPEVVGNPDALFDSLFNLISNSSDALSEAGGVIHVCVDHAILDNDFCLSHPGAHPGDYLILEVIDNGCGIPQHLVDRVHEPFFTTKKPDQGTGLGLAVVFRTIKDMGGYVEVFSIPGLGTSVELYLPCRSGNPGE